MKLTNKKYIKKITTLNSCADFTFILSFFRPNLICKRQKNSSCRFQPRANSTNFNIFQKKTHLRNINFESLGAWPPSPLLATPVISHTNLNGTHTFFFLE